jgi:hypothetical protein
VGDFADPAGVVQDDDPTTLLRRVEDQHLGVPPLRDINVLHEDIFM